jgi:hypothetical protein
MEQSTAQRKLVKSPPELWAEVSSEDNLGRHLAEFGEIRITRTDPETTVAWEGDRASGTVELAPAGWGTQVVLTATPAVAAQAAPEPEREPDPDPEPVPVVFRATPVRVAPRDPDPAARRGFFARLFGRGTPPEAAIPGPPPTPTPDPSPPAPGPDPAPLPPIDPTPPGPEPDPAPMPPQIRLDPQRTVAILTEVLDDLGGAHRRPFARD